VIKHNGDYTEGPVNVFCKINSFLKRKHTVCRTSEMTHVFRGNPFQAHSLQQNYHPTQALKWEKYNTK
jgi:hypothetical protein